MVSERAERAALVITTNLAFSEWTQVFANARLCKAMVDRVTDQAHIIDTKSPLGCGERWRAENGKAKPQEGMKTVSN